MKKLFITTTTICSLFLAHGAYAESNLKCETAKFLQTELDTDKANLKNLNDLKLSLIKLEELKNKSQFTGEDLEILKLAEKIEDEVDSLKSKKKLYKTLAFTVGGVGTPAVLLAGYIWVNSTGLGNTFKNGVYVGAIAVPLVTLFSTYKVISINRKIKGDIADQLETLSKIKKDKIESKINGLKDAIAQNQGQLDVMMYDVVLNGHGEIDSATHELTCFE